LDESEREIRKGKVAKKTECALRCAFVKSLTSPKATFIDCRLRAEFDCDRGMDFYGQAVLWDLGGMQHAISRRIRRGKDNWEWANANNSTNVTKLLGNGSDKAVTYLWNGPLTTTALLIDRWSLS